MFASFRLRKGLVAVSSAAALLLASCSLLFEAEEGGTDGDAGGIDAPEISVDAELSLSFVPSFELDPLLCGVTEIVPARFSLTPPLGEPDIASLRWVLTYGGVELMNKVGPIAGVIISSAHVLGGSFDAPEFNLTLYHGPNIGRVMKNSAGFNIFNVFSLNPGPHSFEGVFWSTAGFTLEVKVRDQAINTNYGFNESFVCGAPPRLPCEELSFYKKSFDTLFAALPATDASSMLQFVFYETGTYYFDRLGVFDDSRAPGIADPSFENFTSSWGASGGGGNFVVVPIPGFISRYGEYSLSLSAIDVNGVESAATTRIMDHQACAL